MVGRQQVANPHRQMLSVGRGHSLAARQAARVLQQHLRGHGSREGAASAVAIGANLCAVTTRAGSGLHGWRFEQAHNAARRRKHPVATLTPAHAPSPCETNRSCSTCLHRSPHAQQLCHVGAARHRLPQLCNSALAQLCQRGCHAIATAGARVLDTDGCHYTFGTRPRLRSCQLGAEVSCQTASQRRLVGVTAGLGCMPPQQLKKVGRAPAVSGALSGGDIVEKVGAALRRQLWGRSAGQGRLREPWLATRTERNHRGAMPATPKPLTAYLEHGINRRRWERLLRCLGVRQVEKRRASGEGLELGGVQPGQQVPDGHNVLAAAASTVGAQQAVEQFGGLQWAGMAEVLMCTSVPSGGSDGCRAQAYHALRAAGSSQ